MKLLNIYTGALALLAATISLPLQAQENVSRILFTNVNVFDGTNEALIENANVLVEGNLIKTVSTDRIAAEGATVIDGGGRTLMPGLIEAHGHMAQNAPAAIVNSGMYWDEVGARMTNRAKNYLDLGFTTVRDVGGWVMGLKKAIDIDIVPGPRIYAAGPAISQTSGHGDYRTRAEQNPFFGRLPDNPNPRQNVTQALGHVTLADGADEVRKAVRENFSNGTAFIKLLAGGGVSSQFDPLESIQYTREELAAAQQEAEHFGTYVTVHAHMDEAINNALDAGITHFEHASIMTDETMKRLGEVGAYICPQAYLFLQDPDKNPSWTDDIQRKKAQLAYAGVDNVFKKAERYGIKVLWGTDVIGPPEVFEGMVGEWKYRAPYFSNVDQLKQATSLNAEVLAQTTFRNPYPTGPLGVIKEGAYADLLLIDGNPIEDIMIMTKPREKFVVIMKDGKIYKNTLNR